jgi:anhydro-N-acetylmuramic acid kinase
MSEVTRLIAGAMSGTSGDGVDVAITRIAGRGLDMSATLVQHHHVPFDASIRQTLFAVRDTQQVRLSDLATLGREISLTYARAVNEALGTANLRANDLSAIAAHGQTLYHAPPNTIQWFDPSLVAAEVGCAVVSDFRRADCAVGGQGAPLVPFADYVLFRDATKSRALLNLGGIANITFLPAGAHFDEIIAFDTGPANCIIDFLMRPQIDRDGRLGSRGRVHSAMLRALLKSPYFHRPPPKSTDGPEMIEEFQRARADIGDLNPLSARLATAAALTAETVVMAIEQWSPKAVDEVVVSGGGTKNLSIMTKLAQRLGDVQLRATDELGVSGDAKEAIAFAILGAATLDGVPSNVPSVTGARRTVVLGSITPRP